MSGLPAETPGRDEFEGALPERLDPEEIRRMSRIEPAISALHIAGEWALIVAAGWLCWRFWHPLLYPVAVAFIGARQHALLILMHDGAHYRLFRSRALNDWVGELLLAWPFVVVSMRAYRRNHFPHHRHLNTAKDPDWVRKQTSEWVFPKNRWQLALVLLQHFVGVGFLKFVVTARRVGTRATSDPEPPAFRLARVAYLAAICGTLTLSRTWTPFLLFWVLPFVTWTQLVFHVRSIAEHFSIRQRSGVYAETRTVITTWFDELFVLSKNGNYHLEHHLYPSVPFHRLRELHRALMSRESYRSGAHVTRGYWRVLGECAAP